MEIAKRHAAIPQALNTAYTIAPISRITADPGSMPKKNERFKGRLRLCFGRRQGLYTDNYVLATRYEDQARCIPSRCSSHVGMLAADCNVYRSIAVSCLR